MKKALVVMLAVLISVAFVTTVFAQKDEPKPGAGPAGAASAPKGEKVEKADKADKAKVATMKYAGAVEKVDGMMVTVKGKKDSKTFDVTNAKFKGYKDAAAIKAGDKVGVTYEMAADKAMAKMFAKMPGAAKADKAPTALPADQPAPGKGPGSAPLGGEPKGK